MEVRANAALYFSQYRQVVITSQTVDATGAPFTAPQNVGSADIKGLELELEAVKRAPRPAAGTIAQTRRAAGTGITARGR